MYQALYRKYRPLTFSDVLGQEHIVKTLRAQIADGNISHAYLFCGTRGTGKTSCAKILARAVNCPHGVEGDPCNACPQCQGILNESTMDVVEIDAATNTGVGDVRELREELIYAPASVKYRVYIIDEVHMLSNQAFNALLKTLEEPPAHVIFVLATTEIHKIPATILSRCQRFDFKRLTPDLIAKRLAYVAEKEGFALESEAAALLARLADGAMRDGLSLLDRCRNGSEPVTLERVEQIVGVCSSDQLLEAVRLAWKRDASGLLKFYKNARERYAGPAQLFADLSAVLRDLLVCSVSEHPEELMECDERELQQKIALSRELPTACVMRMMRTLQTGIWELSRTADKGLLAEMTLISLCREELGEDLASLSARIARLERGVPNVAAAAPASAPAPVAEKPKAEKPAPVKTPESAAAETPSEGCPFWDEMKAVLQDTGHTNLLGFLLDISPKVQGERLILETDQSFCLNFLDQPEHKAALTAAAESAGGKHYTVVLKEAASSLSADDPLNELSEI
ncbi:MAG: DNA polymerase III subunit gamma/tau [Clostridia bacterium]|nr:DNA polymerase III subunit gamma/tau [Clostridia bacterium]